MYGWGALNCPGDPGCPGYVPPYVNAAITGDPTQSDADFAAALNWFDSGGPPTQPTAQAQSATQWLNANSGKVALGVGGFFVLMMFAKAGR